MLWCVEWLCRRSGLFTSFLLESIVQLFTVDGGNQFLLDGFTFVIHGGGKIREDDKYSFNFLDAAEEGSDILQVYMVELVGLGDAIMVVSGKWNGYWCRE